MDSCGNSPPSGSTNTDETPQLILEPIVGSSESQDSSGASQYVQTGSTRSTSLDEEIERNVSNETFLGYNSNPGRGFRLPKNDEVKSIGFMDIGVAMDGYFR